MILGISFSHNATACVVDPADGGIVFCCSEERFTRRKNEWGIPGRVLEHIFEKVAPPREITHVAVGESCMTRYGCAEFASLLNLENYAARNAAVRSKVKGLRILAKEGLMRGLGRGIPLQEIVTAQMAKMGMHAPVSFMDHHGAHAAAAWFGSPFETALVITLDGEGDGCSGGCWRGSGAELSCVERLPGPASLGLFYRSITALLGLKVNQQEGQVQGLAARGDPNRFYTALSRVLRADVRDGRLEVVSEAAAHHMALFGGRNARLARLLRVAPPAFAARDWGGLLDAILAREYGRFYRGVLGEDVRPAHPATAADIAAGAQRVFEETALTVLRCFQTKAPFRQLALAGGVFANVSLNQRILEQPGVDSICVHPGMGDEGLALGAALAQAHHGRAAKSANSALRHVYLGTAFSEVDAEQVAARSGMPREQCGEDELAAKVAAALAGGAIVGVCRGRGEYGPRALGRRSILADPRQSRVCALLNEALKRPSSMPFAPAVLDVCFDDMFDSAKLRGAAHAARFMTVTLNVRPEWRGRAPAIVHIDGTARPQLLREEDDAFFYAVVSRFRRLTGIGCVLNTSLNAHEEPIVDTPAQALALLDRGPLDFLVLGSLWVQRTRAAASQTSCRLVLS